MPNGSRLGPLGGPAAWPCAHVHALALAAEQRQELDGLAGDGGAEPVRGAGVELGDLARFEDEVVLAEDDEGPVICGSAGHGPFDRRRMGDSNPRGLYPTRFPSAWEGVLVYFVGYVPAGRGPEG